MANRRLVATTNGGVSSTEVSTDQVALAIAPANMLVNNATFEVDRLVALDATGLAHTADSATARGLVFGGDMAAAEQVVLYDSGHVPIFAIDEATGDVSLGGGTGALNATNDLNVNGMLTAVGDCDVQGALTILSVPVHAALSGSAALNFGSTAAGTSSDLTITVTGAEDGDVVALSVPVASQTANGVFSAFVSAADTVTVRFTNTELVSAIDPASGTFKVLVFK